MTQRTIVLGVSRQTWEAVPDMKKGDKEVSVTGINMMNMEDKEQKSKVQIIGIPKEENHKISLEVVIITNERIGSIFF